MINKRLVTIAALFTLGVQAEHPTKGKTGVTEEEIKKGLEDEKARLAGVAA